MAGTLGNTDWVVSLIVLGALAVVKELMLDECVWWQVEGAGGTDGQKNI